MSAAFDGLRACKQFESRLIRFMPGNRAVAPARGGRPGPVSRATTRFWLRRWPAPRAPMPCQNCSHGVRAPASWPSSTVVDSRQDRRNCSAAGHQPRETARFSRPEHDAVRSRTPDEAGLATASMTRRCGCRKLCPPWSRQSELPGAASGVGLAVMRGLDPAVECNRLVSRECRRPRSRPMCPIEQPSCPGWGSNDRRRCPACCFDSRIWP
jgi:hypothetical protein